MQILYALLSARSRLHHCVHVILKYCCAVKLFLYFAPLKHKYANGLKPQMQALMGATRPRVGNYGKGSQTGVYQCMHIAFFRRETRRPH